jgi:alkylation response protein AidB-like acyl-CoA dehydrogenase
VVLAGAQSEPNVAGSELFCPTPDPKLGMRTVATRVDGGYVLRGQKSAFVTNGGIAERYFILARTALDRPMHETLSVFYVPADAPGFATGRRTELIGWKTSHHAELTFDDVRLDEGRRIGPEGGGGRILGMVPEMPIGLAACFVGLARAAYDCALEYSKRRRSWGMPLAQHQTVGVKLADMYCDLHSARLMVWDAALACETAPMEAAFLKAPAAKSHAVEVAIRNAQRCVEILGAYGVAAEYPAGRFLNDAWVGYSCDFTREVLRLGIAAALTMEQEGSPS